jgi:hypothetical protein
MVGASKVAGPRNRTVRRGLISSFTVIAAAAILHAAPAPAAFSAFPGAPGSQHFADGSACPAAPRNRYLTQPAGCLSVRTADVDGDGRPDLILLYARPGTAYRFRLVVDRASGATMDARLPAGDIPATIERLRNVNGRRGVELFIHDQHITTEEEMVVYSAGSGRLIRAGSLPYGGSDDGIRFGFVCHRRPPATIVVHQFAITSFSPPVFRRVWRDTATTYRWNGPRLVRGRTTRRLFETPAPPGREVGARC